MAKKKRGKKSKKPGHDEAWAKAKKLCRLNMADVRMAKEMGMNPRKLVGNRPNPHEPWKGPVKYWIRDMYEKRHGTAEAKRRRKAGTRPSGPRQKNPPRKAEAQPVPKARGGEQLELALDLPPSVPVESDPRQDTSDNPFANEGVASDASTELAPDEDWVDDPFGDDW